MRHSSRLAILLLALAPLASAAATPRIAVAPFDNAADSGEYDALGKGLQSMFATDLAQIEGLELVERARLADLRGELALGEGGELAPETAARVGRLLGATHLLVGTFTVVGEGMRLDARLFEVETGAVALAASAEGEREAFFELHKDVLGQLIEAIELELSPKERAAVARIHTADFEAFQSFSEGIDAFDRQRYDDAVAALERASARDEDFKLARMTLAEYARLVDEIRTRADTLETSRAELARLAAVEEAAGEAEVARRLVEIAADDGDEHQRDRLAALHMLVLGYGDQYPGKARFARLREHEDTFAMERAADQFARRYWIEARALWPATPPVIGTSALNAVPGAESFDEDFIRFRDALFPETGQLTRRHADDIAHFDKTMAPRLGLDRREAAEAYASLVRDWAALDPERGVMRSYLRTSASRLTNVLLLDEATAVLRHLGDTTDDEGDLRLLASAISTNRDLQALLDEFGHEPRAREWLLMGRDGMYVTPAAERQELERLVGGEPSPKTLFSLAYKRQLRGNDDPLLIGDLPVWLLRGTQGLVTGPRTDPVRSRSLRFATPRDGSERVAMLLAGGVPRGELRARFTLDFSPADDWWPMDLHPSEWTEDGLPPPPDGRPRIGLLFGVRDVECAFQRAPETGREELLRPMQGWIVQLWNDEVRLVRFLEQAGSRHRRWAEFETEVVDSKPLSWPRAPVEVRVDVADDRVRVQVGERKVTLDAPDLEPGFQGLAFGGTGYVELSDLRLESP